MGRSLGRIPLVLAILPRVKGPQRHHPDLDRQSSRFVLIIPTLSVVIIAVIIVVVVVALSSFVFAVTFVEAQMSIMRRLVGCGNQVGACNS